MQTTIFDQIAVDGLLARLEAINQDSKPRDRYELLSLVKASDSVYVASAAKASGGIVYNIVDGEGKTPKNMSACWRSFPHIAMDLKEIGLWSDEVHTDIDVTTRQSISR